MLIPPAVYTQSKQHGSSSAESIRAFANEIGIAPGIILGRLEHDRILPYPTRLNAMLKEHVELIHRGAIHAGASLQC